MKTFAETIESGVLTADGAMGSMVARSMEQETPLTMARDLLAANLHHAEIILDIHLQYIAAGARVIYTNTFGASRARLERLGLAADSQALISNAVKLARDARDASGQSVWIAGSISPLSPDWLLDTNPSPATQVEQFAHQVELLLDRGCDLIVLETFSRLDEMLLGLQAVRSVNASVPVVASFSFDELGELESGEKGETVARRVSEQANVQVLGVNCSLGPKASLAILEDFASGTELPLSIKPNAGFSQRLGGRVLYPDMSREYYETFAREALELGARLIGGCCGTTPEQIGVISDTVARIHPAPHLRPAIRVEERRSERGSITINLLEEKPSKLTRMLRNKQFVRTLQIDPQRGPADALNRELVDAILRDDLVDLVDINSSGGSARQDSLQIAAGIERMGLETLPHITPRDASLQGVLAQVLGAYDWGGVRNVLVIIGDPPKGDLYAEAKGVYQVDSIGLVRAIDRLRAGRRVKDRVTLHPFNIGVGVALNQNVPEIDDELVRLEKKIEAGADFVMTQPFFDIEDWHRFHERIANRFDVPIMLGVWPLISAKQAARINENVAGVVIPDKVGRKLEEAGAEAREVGFDLAAKLMAQLEAEDTAAGAYLVAPFKQPKQGLEVFVRLGPRQGSRNQA